MLNSPLKKAVAFALGAVVALVMTTPARATLVTYSTAGSFTGTAPGTDTASITVSGLTVTFNGYTDTVDTEPGSPGFDWFGTFTTSGTPTSSPVSLNGIQFTLYITQSDPSVPGYTSFSSTLTGTIKVNNSQAYVQFDAPLSQTVIIPPPTGGSVIYTITDAGGVVNLFPPKTGGRAGNPAVIDGEILLATVPEPTTIVSALSGLVVLAGMVRYRRYRRRRAL